MAIVNQHLEIKKNEIEILGNNIIIIMQDIEIIKNKILLSQTGIDYLEEKGDTSTDDLAFFRNNIASDSTYLVERQEDLEVAKIQLNRSKQELEAFKKRPDFTAANNLNIEEEIEVIRKEIEEIKEKVNEFNKAILKSKDETQRHMDEFIKINDRIIAIRKL